MTSSRRIIGIIVLGALAVLSLWQSLTGAATYTGTIVDQPAYHYFVIRRPSTGALIDSTDGTSIWIYRTDEETSGVGIPLTYVEQDTYKVWLGTAIPAGVYEFWKRRTDGMDTLLTMFPYHPIWSPGVCDSCIDDTTDFQAGVVARHAIRDDAIQPAHIDAAQAGYAMKGLTISGTFAVDTVDAQSDYINMATEVNFITYARIDSMGATGDHVDVMDPIKMHASADSSIWLLFDFTGKEAASHETLELPTDRMRDPEGGTIMLRPRAGEPTELDTFCLPDNDGNRDSYAWYVPGMLDTWYAQWICWANVDNRGGRIIPTTGSNNAETINVRCMADSMRWDFQSGGGWNANADSCGIILIFKPED
jgi:hypothetical protein